jgi:hypothetical protein
MPEDSKHLQACLFYYNLIHRVKNKGVFTSLYLEDIRFHFRVFHVGYPDMFNVAVLPDVLKWRNCKLQYATTTYFQNVSNLYFKNLWSSFSTVCLVKKSKYNYFRCGCDVASWPVATNFNYMSYVGFALNRIICTAGG